MKGEVKWRIDVLVSRFGFVQLLEYCRVSWVKEDSESSFYRRRYVAW